MPAEAAVKIVIDTKVVISGAFFSGPPGRAIESVGKNGIIACATAEIIEEISGQV